MADCCSCDSDVIQLIYACSGSANTGFLADAVARKLMKEGVGKMTCLAGMGAELSGFLESAKSAGKNIVLDGCPVACAKKIFERLHIPYAHFIMTDEGVEKGKTEITADLTNKISELVAKRI